MPPSTRKDTPVRTTRRGVRLYQQRLIVLLRMAGLHRDEIAATTGQKPGTVASAFNRAVKFVRAAVPEGFIGWSLPDHEDMIDLLGFAEGYLEPEDAVRVAAHAACCPECGPVVRRCRALIQTARFQARVWHRVKAEVDLGRHVIDVYLDGRAIERQVPPATDPETGRRFNL